jgi:hypothetical protein
VETLRSGIGYYHEALDKQDKRIVQRLFESGAIQVLVASKVVAIPSYYRFIIDKICRKPPGVFPSPVIW